MLQSKFEDYVQSILYMVLRYQHGANKKRKRIAIPALYKAGKNGKEIFQTLKSSRMNQCFVYRTLKRLKETGGTDDRPRSGSPTSVRTPKIVKTVRERVI